MKISSSFREQELSDYLHSDYLTEAEKDAEADIPVPDRLLPKREYQRLVRGLRLSQRIGLLIWLNRNDLLSIGGRERLLYLQSKASFEAIEAGLKFAQRLSRETKLITDFQHHMRELNRRPQSKHFRQSEIRRIGVGYRDKGMLPEQSFKARQEAQRESFIPSSQLPERIMEILQKFLPSCLTEDGEWVDLMEFSQDLRVFGELSEMTKLLRPL